MNILFKTSNGWEDKIVTFEECKQWFKDHTDKDGNVNEDVIIFKDATIGVETDKSIGWTLSDDSIDRDFERFDSSGWQLKEFKKNPVLLWSHNHDIPAIGRVHNPKVKDGRLTGKVEFDPEDELAQQIERKVKAGYISAGSVGFFPMKVELPEDDDKSEVQLIYRKQELREFSICNIPANPNAVVEPEKSSNPETQPPVLVTQDIRVDEILATIEDMKMDIENLKTMQMDMSDKITKDDTDFYHQLFNEKKPSNQNGLKPFSEKSVDEILGG